MDHQKRDYDEMRQLKALRKTIDERIEYLQHRLYAPRVNNGRNPTVDTTKMIPYIQRWIDSGKSLIALSDGCGVSERTVTKALRGESISEVSADRILSYLGVPHVYNEIVPLPPETQFYEE